MSVGENTSWWLAAIYKVSIVGSNKIYLKYFLNIFRSQRDKSSGVPSTLKVADAQKVVIHDLKRAVEEEKQRKKQKLEEEEMDQEDTGCPILLGPLCFL